MDFDQELENRKKNVQLASVKKAFLKESISPEELEFRVKCIAKSKRDITFWANSFFRIITLDNGLLTIKLYPKQEDLLNSMIQNNRSIVLSARQTGKTTSYTVFCLWLATLFPEKKILIAANKMATATEVMDRIRRGYDYLPDFIKPGVVTYNKNKIEFDNMSSIAAFATSSSACRGASANILILDELAFLLKNLAVDFFNSVVPIISSSKNGKIIIVSTPNGASGLYYDIWQKATSKDSAQNDEGWVPFRIYWWEVPGRDEAWKQAQINSYGLETWKQEYECEFLSSKTKKLIPDDITEQYRMKLSEHKKLGLLDAKELTIISLSEDKVFKFKMWHRFKPDHTYIASADIGEGLGSDTSVLYIWDITDLRKITMCAKFSSNTISLTEFEYVITKICALYNNPWFIAERNGVGAGVLDHLEMTYQYPRLVREGKLNLPGVFSHLLSKSKGCLWTREMMTTQGFGFEIYDEDLLDDFSTFIKHDSKVHSVYSAMAGAHDDHIMAFIWMCYMLLPDVVENYYLVCLTFSNSVDRVYPLILLSLYDPTQAEIDKVINDPIYKDFVEFRKQLSLKYKAIKELEEKDDHADYFEQTKKLQFDRYFGGYIDDSSSWNSSSSKLTRSDINYGNTGGSFFINTGGGWSF